MDNTTPVSYKTIEEIKHRKAALLKDIQKDDFKIRSQWNSLFYKPEPSYNAALPSRRINNIINTGAGILDAFILGWKLYRKFKK